MVSISVLIVTHDRKEFLIRSVNSIINQTLSKNEYEIIVIKGFVDELIDQEIAASGCKIINLDGEKRIGRLIRKGLEVSSGNIIAFLEDDDTYQSNKLSVLISRFEDREIAYYHNSFNTISSDFSKLGFWKKSPSRSYKVFVGSKSFDSVCRKYDIAFNLSSIAVRRKCFEGWDDLLDHVNGAADFLMFAICTNCNGSFYIDSEKLTNYYLHNSSSNYRGFFDRFIEHQKDVYERRYFSAKRIYDSFIINKKSKSYIEPYISSHLLMIKMLEGKKVSREFIKNILQTLKRSNQNLWYFLVSCMSLSYIFLHRFIVGIWYFFLKK